MPSNESPLPRNLEVEVEAELALDESSRSDNAAGISPAEWLFDPLDVQREEIGLRSLLGAVEAIEGDPEPSRSLDVTRGTGHGD